MPATAGRVRMPANNRVHSSAALQTHGIWQSAIGYDPYAPTSKEEPKKTTHEKSEDPENSYTSFQGLLALARITGSNNDEARGCCKKCGRVGHLTYQCRNFLSTKEGKDGGEIEGDVAVGLEKVRRCVGRGEVEEESSEEEEKSESEDGSDVDSEIEKIIAERYGKKKRDEYESDSGERKRVRRLKKRRRRSGSESEDEEEGRSKRRGRKRDVDSDESEDEDRRRVKRKSRKEKRRRRSRRDRSSDDSDDSDESEVDGRGRRQKRRNKVAASSDSDVSGDDVGSRVGRSSSKRYEKKSRKRHHRKD
ncbi:unnamed protein product [Eruca vesicaria subsp. sativa]|uniref:CCHC-type domain-containing protein n=1 Tax=Eruca vesicaria subsp. sativa TaxID=29727 RepID=A0ABC8IVC1_ERUVS|nr:unnamed protein product [Eruca vesicaria subsp. sativa]